MKPSLIKACGLVALLAFAFPSASLFAGETPAFIQVGKKYDLFLMNNAAFTVLEIGKDGWIKIQFIKNGQKICWMNLNNFQYITPLD